MPYRISYIRRKGVIYQTIDFIDSQFSIDQIGFE